LRPSVDRALLNNNDPSKTQEVNEDLVVSVWAHEVRSLEVRRGTDNIRPADVEPRPTPTSPAHAEIYLLPQHSHRRVFDKVIERLALLACWVIGPVPPLRSEGDC
jgi:hypothetical protein